MKGKRIQLFHNKYRHLIYWPSCKTLVIHWIGEVPEEEQYTNILYLQELLKLYEVDHIKVNSKKAKSISFRPLRTFMEKVLKQVSMQGGKTVTFIQRKIENEAFVLSAYKNALRGYGIDLKLEFAYD